MTNIQDIMAAHTADLGSALDADPDLRQTLFNSHRFALTCAVGAVYPKNH